ncbi:MAG: ABC transporter substrate-binding protein [Candidatus Baltobacteraceae bacterium]
MIRSCVVAVLLVLCSCTSVQTGTTSKPGAELRIAQLQEPASLDPLLLNGTVGLESAYLIYDYLLKIDDRGRLVPGIATEVPSLSNGGVSSDQRHIIYHLRHGVKFSDGVELTAADVVFTASAVNNPKNLIQSRLGYDQIERLHARDRYTVEVTLKRPWAPFLVMFCAPGNVYPVMPKHILAKFPDVNQIDFSGHPVGSGPYTLVEWRRGDRVVLQANKLYWKGTPRIPRIELRFTPDHNAMVNRLASHDVDAVFNTDPSVVPQLRAIDSVAVTLTPIDGQGALIFNMRDPVTRDVRVRRALSMGIDVAAMVAKASQNVYAAADAGRGLFKWAYNPGLLTMPRYDPAGARRLLDQAGWITGPDGMRSKNGKPLDILLISEKASQSYAIIANSVQQYEKALGANVTLKEFAVEKFAAPPALGGPVYSGKFGIAQYPFLPGLDPDVTDQFACDRVPPNGFNKPRYCSKEMDAALARSVSTFDRAQRQLAYNKIQSIVSGDLPMLLIYQVVQVNAFPKWIKHQTFSPASPFWDVDAWRR